MRKFFLWIIVAVFLTGCHKENEPVKLGYDTWVGYEAVVVTDKMNFFKNEGVNVQLYPYNDLVTAKQAFDDNKLDVLFTTTYEATQLANNGQQFKIVLFADYPNNSDLIVAQPGITSLSDLKGKRIGLEVQSLARVILLKALSSAGVNVNDTILVNESPQDVVQAFKDKQVDAIVTWPPYSDQAEQLGGHIIYNAKVSDEVYDVMIMQQDFINNHPDEAQNIVTAYLKTLDWVMANKTQSIAIMANASGESPNDFAKDFNDVQLTPIADNLKIFGTPQSQGPLYSSYQNFIDFLYNNQLISQHLQAANLIDPTFIWNYEKTKQ